MLQWRKLTPARSVGQSRQIAAAPGGGRGRRASGRDSRASSRAAATSSGGEFIISFVRCSRGAPSGLEEESTRFQLRPSSGSATKQRNQSLDASSRGVKYSTPLSSRGWQKERKSCALEAKIKVFRSPASARGHQFASGHRPACPSEKSGPPRGA